MVNKALILNQPRGPPRTQLNRPRSIRHRIRRIGDVTIECVHARRRLSKREFSFGVKIKRARSGGLWRPGVVTLPFIHARTERKGFRKIRRAFSFEVISKKLRENLFAIVRGGLAAEIDL